MYILTYNCWRLIYIIYVHCILYFFLQKALFKNYVILTKTVKSIKCIIRLYLLQLLWKAWLNLIVIIAAYTAVLPWGWERGRGWEREGGKPLFPPRTSPSQLCAAVCVRTRTETPASLQTPAVTVIVHLRLTDKNSLVYI